jgi:putative copper resistance protein D
VVDSGVFRNWHADPGVIVGLVAATALYACGAIAFARARGRGWPAGRTAWFAFGILSIVVAIESPLDAAGDARFSWHMVQHLILTDVTAPALLLGAPLLLALGALPTRVARIVVGILRGPVGKTLGFPPLTWTLFILSLWVLHFTAFYEASLENESLHALEHVIYLTTALLFWFPVVAIGPTPWAQGPLAHPLRLLYLLVAMPAEGMLGFVLNGSQHVLYPHYAAAGLADQQAAGEIMWVGATLAMFVAFMIVGFQWARHEERLGEQLDRMSAARDVARLV